MKCPKWQKITGQKGPHLLGTVRSFMVVSSIYDSPTNTPCMTKISTSVLLIFLGLLIACEKTKLPPEEDSISFHISSDEDQQPVSGVTVSLYKKISTSPDYQLVSEIGKTDSEGKLVWPLPKDPLTSNYQFVFEQQGYDRISIPLSDPLQKKYQVVLSKAMPFSFYVSGAADKLPLADVAISLYKKIAASHPLFPTYELAFEIGRTDSGGKLSWDYPKHLLNSDYKLIFDKGGYYRGSIQISDSPKHEYEVALDKIARVNFHLTYNNDTIPKKFHCYRQYLSPASHYSPPTLSYDDFLTTQSVTQIDKTLWIDLPRNSSQTIYCYMVDASTNLNPSHSYPSSAQLKTFVLPSNAKDTTIVIEAFWK